jgi:predicted nuclease of predicted toxin-antitoxin system
MLNSKKQHRNNQNDAIIGATAIANNLTLITDDINLAKCIRERRCVALSFSEFINIIQDEELG